MKEKNLLRLSLFLTKFYFITPKKLSSSLEKLVPIKKRGPLQCAFSYIFNCFQ